MPSNPSNRPVSPLRARMIEDMTVRGFTEKTRQDYVRHVQAFAAFIGRSPASAKPEDIRGFQLHQRQSGIQPPSINTAVSALRFLFTVTLDRPELARRLTVVRQPRRLPAVLSVEEIALLLQAAPGPKYKAAFATAYGAGLRVSEVVALSRIAYNSCRNRHCPKCQGAAARDWLAAREADLLPVGYFHLVFTLPAEIGAIAYQNKAVVYDLLFRTAAETLLTIAADPKHLGARIGFTAVLHSWGSAMTHHPHLHMIVPGGGISLDGTRWVGCRPGFLLPVRVLSHLFRRLFLTALADAHAAGRLEFFGEIEGLRCRNTFAAHLAPLRRKNWFVYAKSPFAGPEAVLAYLARYTHRVAISNSRLLALDERGITFRYKDYRRNGQARYRTMALAADEFIRRFLLHILPKGFHRIRHYGLLASAGCKTNIARARELIAMPVPVTNPPVEHDADPTASVAANHRPPCPCCGGHMIVVETFERGGAPRGPPPNGPRVRTATP